MTQPALWIFIPQKTLGDGPAFWIFFQHSRIRVKFPKYHRNPNIMSLKIMLYLICEGFGHKIK